MIWDICLLTCLRQRRKRVTMSGSVPVHRVPTLGRHRGEAFPLRSTVAQVLILGSKNEMQSDLLASR